ncbi:MAG: flagellar basal-body rod protein FlgF [Desulfocapsaceae bacterium]|nr:flagellar basal-body rod protein FlgF [Desulfocapsaceae bacterium]
MVSGKYSALSGAVAFEQNLDNISANLANVSTVGYKKSNVSFESLLRGAQQIKQATGINYTRIRANYTDFANGPINKTDSPLDVAINGEGFFKVQGQNGVLYTRDGSFTLDAAGTLLSSSGKPVLDDSNSPITIPSTDGNRITITGDGTISVIDDSGNLAQIGRLGIVKVDDPLKLQKESDTTFSLVAGGQEVPIERPSVVQGGLEISNVNMVKEMADMINTQRTFETYNKVLKTYATIGDTQDDLGTLE